MYSRPDRPLVVKCTFDRWNKRITFSSARNCTYDLLRHKVEQCFSLYTASYAIAYKDDDGEVTDITTETDLTEAIQYFQAGNDDPPMSSAASILSGRSFGNRKITLRVNISVDYDGPSLSDTSSLVSLEEYKGRNGSQYSFSFGAPSVAPDDDSVTVSSRDAGAIHPPSPLRSRPPESMSDSEAGEYSPPRAQSALSWDDGASLSLDSSIESKLLDDNPPPDQSPTIEGRTAHAENPFSDENYLSASPRYLEDTSGVFERLRLQDNTRNDSHIEHDLMAGNRGAAWLRDQNERTIRSMLGALPEPSESDSMSLAPEHEAVSVDSTGIGGDLALRRDPRGKYYYSYTSVASSGASQIQDAYSEGTNSIDEIATSIDENGWEENQRPTSMQLNWLAAQQVIAPQPPPRHTKSASSLPTSKRSALQSHNSDPLPAFREHDHIYSDIPADVLQFLPISPPLQEILTDCSECGVLLDSIRYVCSTCGEKKPVASRPGKGKGKPIAESAVEYPPARHRTLLSTSPATSSSSYTFVEDFQVQNGVPLTYRHKPLPSLPPLSSSPSTLTVPGVHTVESGYELCSGCIESAGVTHAIEVGLASHSSPSRGNSSPSSPEDAQRALSQWRRSAPKQKGQLRHAYQEKVWGHHGWADVEQDESQTKRCSTCNTVNLGKRYKCASCEKFNLCRACYGQVHDLHPSHAFFVIPDRPVRSRSEPDVLCGIFPDPHEEQSMKHPGVKCAHCMLDIIGARFHCAVCEGIDICSNCESAGLPGNLDSSDGGHNSSHIMIKIPYPVETTEIQNVSRRAINLWTGRDAANVERATPRTRSNSLISSYARTVVGSGRRDTDVLAEDHGEACKSCNQPIIGTRYQCANCPSLPTPYSLCSSCEERSYIVHDPMHMFFKFPRPLQRPLRVHSPLLPILYKAPVGPAPGMPHSPDPKEYLKSLVHSIAVCDRCMTRIQGEWFRCAYCPKDLCDTCEYLDTHDDSHAFLVLKSTVDMQQFGPYINLDNARDARPIIPYPVYT